MPRLKRATSILRWSTAAGLLLAGSLSHATTVRHLETRELTIDSQQIVIGEVQGTHSHWNPSHTKILTEVSIKVSRWLKGGPGGSLTLTQLGGVVDGVRYNVPACPSFTAGEEALFFVWSAPDGRAQVNGLAQGKFEITRDAKTGERVVQRRASGFAVSDARSLSAVLVGQKARPLLLSDLVGEIERTLATGTDR